MVQTSMSVNTKIIVKNRKAFHEYEIIEKFLAGIALTGTEIKSIRAGKINISDGWVEVRDESLATIHQVDISPYTHGNIYNHTPQRPRQLLLKKKEIKQLYQAVKQKGLSVIPLKVLLRGQFVKIEIALAKGRNLYDKREKIKEQEVKREMQRVIKHQ